jgi:hypothetical protein
LRYLFSPCGGTINELKIDGKRFDHVRGERGFYLQVPHTNAIVFVVDEKDNSVTYHIFNMDTDEDIAIHARGSIFGYNIGYTNDQRDSVEVGDDGNIILCNIDKGAKSTLSSLANLDSIKSVYILNPSKKTVVVKKTFYYNKAGKPIRQSNCYYDEADNLIRTDDFYYDEAGKLIRVEKYHNDKAGNWVRQDNF